MVKRLECHYCSNSLWLGKQAKRSLVHIEASGWQSLQAQEGRIEEASAAWKGMTQKAQEIRQRINEEKDLKLRSPNFVVSRTRLCLHNLPASLGEAALQQHVTSAVSIVIASQDVAMSAMPDVD